MVSGAGAGLSQPAKAGREVDRSGPQSAGGIFLGVGSGEAGSGAIDLFSFLHADLGSGPGRHGADLAGFSAAQPDLSAISPLSFNICTDVVAHPPSRAA